jgi:hypothetical protein
MKKHKHQSAWQIMAIIVFVLFAAQSARAQTYTVGVPVCDTISTWIYPAGPCEDDYLIFRLNSTLSPYVTGLYFQVVITAINGRIWSNLSDTVKVGDVLPLTPYVPSGGLTIFLGSSSSSFNFITRIVGTPMVAYESYYCGIRVAQTTAACQNYLVYWGEGSICQVQPSTSVKYPKKNFPADYILVQNYPNPFNASTTIEIALAKPGEVTLKVFNHHGQEIITLVDDKLAPGKYLVPWHANGLTSGVYFYLLKTNGVAQAKKLLLLK